MFDPKEAASTERVVPDIEDFSIGSEAEDFIFSEAGKVNTLIEGLGHAAIIGDTELYGTAIAALFCFAFKLGMRFAEQSKED